jgi:dTMP kinase
MTKRGAFISLEGVEGVGKSTNVAFVAEALRARGIATVVTREPGGTPLGEQVREWILHGRHEQLSADVETLLMFAARAQHLDRVIRPALAAGRWVICDRFTDATVAYQGGGRGVARAFIEHLRADVQRGLEPDRIATRTKDHFEREQRPFFQRVRDAYLALAAREPSRIVIIDAAQPLEDVQRAIGARLDVLVEGFDGQ